MKNKLIVRQDGNNDCGAACLLSIVRYYGGDITLDRMIEITMTDRNGTNFYNLSLAANKLGLTARCFELDKIDKLLEVNLPIISQIKLNNYNHFVVVYKINDNKIILMDPSYGKKVIDIYDFNNMWTGYIMTFSKYQSVPIITSNNRLNLIIIDFLKANKKNIVFTIFLSVMSILFLIIFNLYSKIILDKIILTNLNNLIIITFFFFILLIMKNITNFIRNFLVIFLNQKLDINVILETYSKIILLPYKFFRNRQSGEIITRFNDLSIIKNFLSKLIVTLNLDFVMYLLSLVIIYFINYKIDNIILIFGLFHFFLFLLTRKAIHKFIVLVKESDANLNNYLIESIEGFESIKNLNLESNNIYYFSKLYCNYINNIFLSEKLFNILNLIRTFLGDLEFLIINFYAFKLMFSNKILFGDYSLLIILYNYFIMPFNNSFDIINEYYYVKNAIKRGNSLLEIEEENLSFDNDVIINGNITIRNLNYSFNQKDMILNNINLKIKDKERVLILGKSGSGKSTLMKILYKYYKIPVNTVFINNLDLSLIELGNIRKNIVYISQNENLFTGTVRDNIILERKIPKMKFLSVCKLTLIDKIIDKKSEGYDFQIKEGGINISGGERQKIVLARSLLKDSKIIIIDEGLNQIDIESERKILINLFSYYSDKTFIIISHRKNNLDLYNKVVSLIDGKINSIEEKI